MKYLIMCEGPNELEIINILLENNMLICREDDLLGLRPYHARQIDKSALVKTELNMYTGEPLSILRIGDTQSDELRIPKEYADKINANAIRRYCTKPELEMLLIISEGMQKEYEKRKSDMKPKDFAKHHIKYGRLKYNNSSAFFRDYYGNNPELLKQAIINYRTLNGAHRKDELYLADLLL